MSLPATPEIILYALVEKKGGMGVSQEIEALLNL